ncbi:MAG: Mov34/MPN/PAD-1 family protein [Solirubrobacteraceae bacterium]
MSLERVKRYEIPGPVIERTIVSLRQAGKQGFERFVLWSGVIDDDRVVIRTAHVPDQTAYKTTLGLMVRVEGEALHELNHWLYKHRETLAAQVHAHPTDAFHSSTDDAYPIVTVLGGLSIVVPDFARRGFFVRDLEAYRLTESGWCRIRRRQFRKLIRVT